MGRITHVEADDMEIWQIAVYLGVSTEVGDPDKNERTIGASREARAAADLARNRARLAAATGQGPPVEADTLDQAAFTQFAGTLNRVSS